MDHGITQLFSKAASYCGYYRDVLSTIPSPKVRDILTEQGWRFVPSEFAEILIHMPLIPGSSGSLGLPIETVLTETGARLYRSHDRDTIKKYEDAKKDAAAQVHGINQIRPPKPR